MEKINIAELLNNCPKGMELVCTTWENVTFEKVVNDEIYIKRNNKTPSFDKIVILNKYGCCTNHQDEKCRIFPKGKNTWEGFVPPCQFNDGDIVADKKGNIAIYKQIHKSFKEPHIDFYCGLVHNCGLYNELFVIKNDEYQNWGKIKYIGFATEEEKQMLFDAIKANGYHWNAETKNLEKINDLKFKIGDRITNGIVAGKIRSRDIDSYQLDNDVFVFFSALEKWKLDTSKFDINTLKPFDQVLVRLTDNCVWMPKLFSHYVADPKAKYYPFVTIENIGFPQCIPYNGNEHLCRKTNNCDEYYKTWND